MGLVAFVAVVVALVTVVVAVVVVDDQGWSPLGRGTLVAGVLSWLLDCVRPGLRLAEVLQLLSGKSLAALAASPPE